MGFIGEILEARKNRNNPFIQTNLKTFYEVNKKLLLEQIKKLEKKEIDFISLDNRKGDWIQFLCFGKDDFYLERGETQQETKKINNSKMKNIENDGVYYYNKNLNRKKLIKICIDILKFNFKIDKKYWKLAITGYKDKDGLIWIQWRAPGHGEMVICNLIKTGYGPEHRPVNLKNIPSFRR